MSSRTRRSFWTQFAALPTPIQQAARAKFAIWRNDPFHPALQFKQLRPALGSVRINDNHRALAYREGELVVWFWIGTHAEYDRLIKN